MLSVEGGVGLRGDRSQVPVARKSQRCWGSGSGSGGLERQQEGPWAWGLAGVPLRGPGKRWQRCAQLSVRTVALRTSPHHPLLPGGSTPAHPAASSQPAWPCPATAQVPSSGPHNLGRVGPGPGPSWGAGAGLGDCGLFSASLFKAQLGVVPAGPSPPTAAAGRAARELGHCISHCCRDAGPGGPGCFPAQLWLFLHAPWAPS